MSLNNRDLNAAVAQLTSNWVMVIDIITSIFGSFLVGAIVISELTDYLPEITAFEPLLFSILFVESILIIKYFLIVNQASTSVRALIKSLVFERGPNINGFADWIFDLAFIVSGVGGLLTVLNIVSVFENVSALLMIGLVFIGLDHIKDRFRHVMYTHYDPDEEKSKALGPEELDELSSEEIDKILS